MIDVARDIRCNRQLLGRYQVTQEFLREGQRNKQAQQDTGHNKQYAEPDQAKLHALEN